jgi:phenylacetate-CoA ligase
MTSFFEKYLEYKGYKISKASSEINRLQKMSKEAFINWKTQKKWDLVKYHFDTNSFYQKYLNNKIPEKWEDIPVLQKKDFNVPLNELISSDINLKECYVSSTSGSSGTPLFFVKDKWSHAITWAIVKNRYSWFNIKLNTKQARFYGIPLSPISYISERIKDYLMNRYRFVIFDMSDHKLDKFYQKFCRTKFEFVYGYTNSLVLFSRYLLKNKLNLKKDACPTLKHCIVTSEQCNDIDKQLIEKAIGVPVLLEYGVSESGFIAMTNPEGYWSLSDESLVLEVLDEHNKPLPNGQKGKLVITSLFNTAMPFIRYEVGDIGSIDETTDIFHSELSSLQGRLNDTIYLPSGKTVPAFTLYYVSRQILEETGLLKEYLIKQIRLDSFIFEIVSDKKIGEKDQKKIIETAEKYLEKYLKIEIRQVDQIQKTDSGKHKHFISLLNNGKK